ncbi:MAG: hypothetical protein JXB88_08300, partial [Spirochaetales bacterium]|nr:hypothetical protein [Spirochaetales bacterium]
MKKLIYILILLFVFFQMYSNEIKNYECLFLKTISIGKEEGNIGFLEKIVSGMPRSARAISISKEGNIYIPDFANIRI